MLIDSLDSYILLFLNNKFYYWSLLNCIENSVGDLFIFTRNDIIFYIEKKIYELFFFQQSSFFVTAFRTLMLQQLHQTPIGPSTFLTRHSFRLRMRTWPFWDPAFLVLGCGLGCSGWICRLMGGRASRFDSGWSRAGEEWKGCASGKQAKDIMLDIH